MGPAVLNGGLSTLIAFILLLSSDSYFFLTFFKIFFLVVLFGLFHGLLFLPVLLSLISSKSSDADLNLDTKPMMIKSAWHKTSNFEETSSVETKSFPSFHSVNLQPLSLPGSLEDLDGGDLEKKKLGSPRKSRRHHRKSVRLPPLI